MCHTTFCVEYMYKMYFGSIGAIYCIITMYIVCIHVYIVNVVYERMCLIQHVGESVVNAYMYVFCSSILKKYLKLKQCSSHSSYIL